MKLSKSLKRVMAVVLAVMMLASVCVVSISAATTNVTYTMDDTGMFSAKAHKGTIATEYVADPENAENTVFKATTTTTGETHITLMPGDDAAVTLKPLSVYTVSFKYKFGAGTWLQASNTWNKFDRVYGRLCYTNAEQAGNGGANITATSVSADSIVILSYADNPDWQVEIPEGQTVTSPWKAQYALAADTEWYTYTAEVYALEELSFTDLGMKWFTVGNSVIYMDDFTVTETGTWSPKPAYVPSESPMTLDFENEMGIAALNHGSISPSYAADPEDADNTVFYYSNSDTGYSWRVGAIFGGGPNADERAEGLALQAGYTYDVSFRFKVGAGTTWERTLNEETEEWDYRTWVRLNSVADSFGLGGNQVFGTEIRSNKFAGAESLHMVYMSEVLPDDWAMFIEDLDYENPDKDGNAQPYYIVTSETDTDWIDYNFSFTAVDAMAGQKLAMTLTGGYSSATGWAYEFYMDDVNIAWEKTTVNFNGKYVEPVDGKVTVPTNAPYFLSTKNGAMCFPGDVIDAAAGDAFRAPTIAADNAFSVRTDDTVGIRARAALTQDVITNASEIGFVICPKIAPDLNYSWYSSSAYALKKPISKATVYGAGSAAGTYQYQVCLKGLTENVEAEDFLFAIYATVDGTTSYYVIGCESFADISAALAQ